jgi:hypothetical protein
LADSTTYLFGDLGKNDNEHAGFDDVRSAAMAIAEVKADGVSRWMGASLSTTILGDTVELRAVLERGLAELEALHTTYGVK